jgi:hypothetical protein
MRQFLPSVLALLFVLGVPAKSPAKRGDDVAGSRNRIPAKIQVKLIGPASIRSRESLESQSFKALLTNRSSVPQTFLVRNGFLMNADWFWTLTDAEGSPVGMEFVERWVCGTVPDYPTPPLQDSDVFILGPGESHEFPIPVGPSDDYRFPRPDTYHLFVTLTYVPPNSTEFFDGHGKPKTSPAASGYPRWDLSMLSPEKREALQNSRGLQVKSGPWNLVLSLRHPARR